MSRKRKSLKGNLYQDGADFYHKVKLRKPDGTEYWTFRKLDVATISAAREAIKLNLNAKTLAEGGKKDVVNPYADRVAGLTVGAMVADYIKAGCPKPKRDNAQRTGKQLGKVVSLIKSALPFWQDKAAEALTSADCWAYAEHRRKTVKAGFDCGCAIDMELGLLSIILKWGVSTGRIVNHPWAQLQAQRSFPKFRVRADIQHCKDFMPKSGAEFHGVARNFLGGDYTSEALGFQYLLEGMTGLRTCEALELRWDAADKHQPGFIEERNGKCYLSVHRAKGGCNPFVEIHPALAELLSVIKAWRVWRGLQDSPWFLPSPEDSSKPLGVDSLSQALRRWHEQRLLSDPKAKKYTSHGGRSYCVTVWRAEGKSDSQIAWMIGHNGGAKLVEQIYGSPEGWEGDKNMTFTCDQPAWLALNMPRNVVSMEKAA